MGLDPAAHDEHHQGDGRPEAVHAGPGRPLRHDRYPDGAAVRYLRHRDEDLGRGEVPLPRAALNVSALCGKLELIDLTAAFAASIVCRVLGLRYARGPEMFY